jgi:hypothetical protein
MAQAQQWQGFERRQSQGSYIGEERRKANPPMEQAPEPRDEQQARTQQLSGDDTQ